MVVVVLDAVNALAVIVVACWMECIVADRVP